MSSPPATSSMTKPTFAASTTALRGSQGRSGIPEVPSSGLPSPPTSPPLAALNSSNQLALLPKHKRHSNSNSSSGTAPGRRLGAAQRRGGAALSIREECERFFCESMKTVFRGETNPSKYGSGLSSAYLQTPPSDDEFPFPNDQQPRAGGYDFRDDLSVNAWMEIWDYAGGASFRAFLAGDGKDNNTLFVFFDIQGVLGRDLKKALMALLELADGPLDCSHIVTCIDRRLQPDEAIEMTKSLQWIGFELTTLDRWAHDLDVISDTWVFMGMDV